MRRPIRLPIALQDNDGGRFTIDANTGVVTVAGAIDREADELVATLPFERLRPTVRSPIKSSRSPSSTSMNSMSEPSPIPMPRPIRLPKTAANGTVVQSPASPADADATTNTITYSLDDNAGGRFTIDANTGVVTVADRSLLNYEAATSHNITVRATSTDTSFSTQAFTINLTDVNEGGISAISR